MSQIQGRTYANLFGLVERFINAKMLEVSRHYWLGDQRALEALVRFSDEELKQKARELSEEVFNLRFQLSMGMAKNPSRLSQARRDLARAFTVLRERKG